MKRHARWLVATVMLGAILVAPAAVAVEIGDDDFRISTMGPDGNAAFDATVPAVAYNSTDDRYLVVWEGDSAGEVEIHARLVGGDGEPLGPAFQVSNMGPDGSPNFRAVAPSVAYNPTANEFFVVWSGDDNAAPLVDNELEIFGQRLDGTTGVPLGADDFRISDMGPNLAQLYPAERPDVAYDSTNDRYLVVWSGVDQNADLFGSEYEIHGQFIDGSTGAQVGVDLRMSDMGPDGDFDFDAHAPAVTYNPVADEFLVVWFGDDDTAPLVDGEFEIFGQRVHGQSGLLLPPNDFRISETGVDGSPVSVAGAPDVVYALQPDEYVVVWHGNDLAVEVEIYGQRLDGPTVAPLHSADLRLSHMGPDGDAITGGFAPAIDYDQALEEYLVVWHGDAVDGEFEIYGQRFDRNLSPLGGGVARLSSMGPDGSFHYGAVNPAVAHANPFLVVWSGDDAGSLADNEFEIYGQFWATGFEFVGHVDPAQGLWVLYGSGSATFFFGNPGDFPIMGDWDCDGIDTPGMYRQSDGFVYLRNSNDQGIADIRFFFGNPGDVPIVGDFDSDGCDTVGIYRPSEGRFYIINELGEDEGGLGAAEFSYLFGNPGDKPFIGDFDGDGIDTVGLHRESTGFVYFRNSHTQGIADQQFFFGDPGDRLVAGDWGLIDGIDTPAVFRPSDAAFYFRYTNSQGVAHSQLFRGEPSWLPVAGTFAVQ